MIALNAEICEISHSAPAATRRSQPRPRATPAALGTDIADQTAQPAAQIDDGGPGARGGRAIAAVRVGLLGRSGAGRVQICCKGAPGRDRPREEARNINDSPRASRLDPGLCNRFGQRSPSGAPEAGSVEPIRPTTTAAHPPTPPSVPDRTRTAPHRKTRPRLRSGWRSGRIHDTLIINVW